MNHYTFVETTYYNVDQVTCYGIDHTKVMIGNQEYYLDSLPSNMHQPLARHCLNIDALVEKTQNEDLDRLFDEFIDENAYEAEEESVFEQPPTLDARSVLDTYAAHLNACEIDFPLLTSLTKKRLVAPQDDRMEIHPLYDSVELSETTLVETITEVPAAKIKSGNSKFKALFQKVKNFAQKMKPRKFWKKR